MEMLRQGGAFPESIMSPKEDCAADFGVRRRLTERNLGRGLDFVKPLHSFTVLLAFLLISELERLQNREASTFNKKSWS